MSWELGRGPVLVDCAGAAMGGALRLLQELDDWLERTGESGLRPLGRGRSLSAAHLARRELEARRLRPRRVVALNNVGHVTRGAERWVLLRNALHFPLPDDDLELPVAVRRRLAAQAMLVRRPLRRADLVTVPTRVMGERVLTHLPWLRPRLQVRPHPVSPRPCGRVEPGLVVCPVLFAPYKRMAERLRLLVTATEALRREGQVTRVVVTAGREEVPDLPVVEPVGRLAPEALSAVLARAHVVYYPTTVESFGYPLAEARVNGQWVVAPASERAREVAGAALSAFARPTVEDVAAALEKALVSPAPAPDPLPFSPDRYFGSWVRP